MFSKVFLLTVVCTVTLIESRVVHPEEQVSVIKALGEVEDDLKDLEKKVHENIVEAADLLQNIDEEYKDITETIVKDINKGLNSQTKQLLDQLNELKDQAKQAGIDISDCLSGKEQTLINIPVDFGKKIGRCQKNVQNEFTQITNYAIVTFQLAEQKVDKLRRKLEWCSRSYVPRQCRTGVTYDVYQASKSIPEEILREVTDAHEFDSTYQYDLKTCGSKHVKQALTEGQETLSEIKQCIESKAKHL